MLAPNLSQLKDIRLMTRNHVVMSLPKHGRGAHPKNHNLALDGRGKNLLGNAGSLGNEEHMGSLVWLVGNITHLSEANLTLGDVTFEQHIKVHIPKRHTLETVKWEVAEMPLVPILTNQKALETCAQLLMVKAETKTNYAKQKDS